MFVCVCVVYPRLCRYMCAWMWVHMQTCMWRPEVNIRFILQSLSTLVFETVPHWTWSSSIQIGLLASELQGSTCLCPAVLKVTNTCCHSVFIWVLGISCFCGRHITNWTIFPNHFHFSFSLYLFPFCNGGDRTQASHMLSKCLPWSYISSSFLLEI